MVQQNTIQNWTHILNMSILIDFVNWVVYNVNMFNNRIGFIMDQSRLMERLRLQSIIQRMLRTHGAEVCLEIMQSAIELEMPAITKYSVQAAKTKTQALSKSL